MPPAASLRLKPAADWREHAQAVALARGSSGRIEPCPAPGVGGDDPQPCWRKL